MPDMDDGQDVVLGTVTKASVVRVTELHAAFDLDGNLTSVTMPVRRYETVDGVPTVSSMLREITLAAKDIDPGVVAALEGLKGDKLTAITNDMATAAGKPIKVQP